MCIRDRCLGFWDWCADHDTRNPHGAIEWDSGPACALGALASRLYALICVHTHAQFNMELTDFAYTLGDPAVLRIMPAKLKAALRTAQRNICALTGWEWKPATVVRRRRDGALRPGWKVVIPQPKKSTGYTQEPPWRVDIPPAKKRTLKNPPWKKARKKTQKPTPPEPKEKPTTVREHGTTRDTDGYLEYWHADKKTWMNARTWKRYQTKTHA